MTGKVSILLNLS